MRRAITAITATLLVLSAATALAADAEEAADATPAVDAAAVKRVEVPGVGLAMAFPSDWRVSLPAGTRESPIRTPEDEPIYATTAILANGGDGRWCDVDVYLDMVAPLDEHAYGYAGYLQRMNGADAPMIVVETDITAGPAFRIEVFNPEQARLRAMYLFDGPLAEDGTFDRFLFTCAASSDTEPFWETLVESVEVFPPAAGEVDPAT